VQHDPTTGPPPLTTPLETAQIPRRSAVNLRSILVGLAGVCLIGLITPYNDYVLNNTPLIGGSLPLAVVLFFFLLAVVVNGPLSCLSPRHVLQGNEMAVILAMLLVASVIPAAGLMQLWPPTLAGSWKHMQDQPDKYESMLRNMNLPDWFWTTFPPEARTVSAKSSDEIVTHFYGRIPEESWSLATLWTYMRRWIPPTLGWGVFFLGMFAAVLGVGFIVRKQWVENERITFPIAQVQLALIESPQPGRFFNSTFSARSFWIGVGLICAVRLLIGLNQYFPKFVPGIELKYNLHTVLSEPPLAHIQHIKSQDLFPIVAAIMFFVSTRIAFSLWFTMVLWQVPAVILGTQGAPLPGNFERDCNLGSLVAFAAMIVWTGRHHYRNVVRRMFARGSGEDDPSPFLSMGTAGWMTLGGSALGMLWLVHVGMSWLGAFLLVWGLLLIWIVMAFVVAHSGFPSAVTRSGPREWFLDIFRNADPKNAYSASDVSNHFHVQTIGGMWAYNRDQLLVYTTHGLKAATERAPRAGRRLLGAMVLALAVGFVVSEASTLWCYYKYASTQDKNATTPINAEVLNGQPAWTVNFTRETVHEKGITKLQHPKASDWQYAGYAAGFTGLLAFLQLRYTWWPLHPIGPLMLFAFAIRRLWFSILVGWMAKVLIVKFGGARLFTSAKPFFIGIIVGEVLAASLFALSALVLNLLGVPYEVVRFLPITQF
jgi:hypothetical protein